MARGGSSTRRSATEASCGVTTGSSVTCSAGFARSWGADADSLLPSRPGARERQQARRAGWRVPRGAPHLHLGGAAVDDLDVMTPLAERGMSDDDFPRSYRDGHHLLRALADLVTFDPHLGAGWNV